VVCNVADPQKTQLDRLKNRLPVKQNIPVHITVLPPRPLMEPIELVCERVQKLLERFSVFFAELLDVRLFSESGFLYLDVGRGSAKIHEIHELLNTGNLAHDEAFEFLPHLTLGGPLTAAEVDLVRQDVEEHWRNSGCSRTVLIEELVCLWMDPRDESREWKRYSSLYLEPISEGIAV
jgi:2'-5' RNA ligase